MATATQLESPSSRTDFVGRLGEIAELRAGLEKAALGRTQIFLLSGEPGIGKTRIANEIAADARMLGMRIAWGSCCEGVGTPAYWPLIQVVRSLLAGSDSGKVSPRPGPTAAQIAKLVGDYGPNAVELDTSSQEDPELARFRLFDTVASILSTCAKSQPLLIALDDLQDADPGSWNMLRFIAREVRDAPLMLLLAYRELEARRSAVATQVISDLLRAGRQIALTGLNQDEVAEVVEKNTGRAPGRRFVFALHRTTGGNPFFVTEVVRTLVSSGALGKLSSLDGASFAIPESLRASIRGRLGELSARAKGVLAAAAALGSEFDVIALQRVTGLPIHEILHLLDAAADAELAVRVEESRPCYRFSHALIREALHQDLDDATRVRLHRKIVIVLEDLYRAEPDRHLDELAYHSVRIAHAGLAEKAIEYSIRAGEAAYSAFAYEQAAGHWRSALTLAEEKGGKPIRLARLLERLADAYSIIEFEQPMGIDCLTRAIRLYEGAGKPIEAARARARLAVMLSTRGPSMDIPRALTEYRAAEHVLGKLPETESQVWLYNGLAQTAMQAQRTEEGLSASRRAMEIARRLNKEGMWTVAAAHHSDHLLSAGRTAEALALVDEAWHKADRLDDLRGAFETSWSGGYHLLALWDPRGGQRWFTRELSRPRIAEAASQRQILLQQVAFGHVFRGRLREAMTVLNEAPRAVVRGFALLYLGELDEADGILDEARKLMLAAGSLDGETVCAYFLSLVRRAAGDLSTAESLIGRVIENSARAPIVPFELNARSEMALIAVKRGHPEKALEQVKRCREIMSSGEDFRGILGRAALAEAVTAANLGHHELAEERFAAAVKNFVRYDLPWERAQAEQLWGEARSTLGDRSAAAERFDAAIEIYRRHEAGPTWVKAVETARAFNPRLATSQGWSRAKSGAGAVEGIFRHEGDYWTISSHGSVIRLRNANGLHYLSHLLAHPAERISASELARVTRPGRLHPAKQARSTGGSSERSRVMVTKGIKAAIAKIRANRASLGRHLATSIQTGYWCVYRPDADDLITWRVSKPAK